MFQRERIPIRKMVTVGALPSALQRRVYRRRGYQIASDVEFGPGVVIDAEEVQIGSGASFGPGVVIRARRVRIGPRVHVGALSFLSSVDLNIGADAWLAEQTSVGGPLLPDSELTLGERVGVFQSCYLNPTRPLRIGADTGVGGRSSIFTHGSWQSAIDGYPVAFESVVIGRNVWLPWHVFIMPGVEIGDNATIGGGSVVNRSIPAGTLAAGVPARVIRDASAWPRPVAPDERWTIARNIVGQLVWYLEGNGARCVTESSPDRLEVLMTFDRMSRQISLVRTVEGIRGADDIAIILEDEPPPKQAAPPNWYALGTRRKRASDDPAAREVEAFIGRYGIRFVATDEL